jgi:hypothetical protein
MRIKTKERQKMTIKLKFRDSDARTYEYFLRKRFNSKATLEKLIKFLVVSTVADEAKKESAAAEKTLNGERNNP